MPAGWGGCSGCGIGGDDGGGGIGEVRRADRCCLRVAERKRWLGALARSQAVSGWATR